MKITYLKLKNFASIYVSMHKKTIELDFTKSKNNIILLVGKNGSGKTSILSALHPFAYPGNMDVRNNTNLILDGEDGYKEIWIETYDAEYKIQHFYKSTKNQVSVKSFIQKDGNELNPNGNVRSFHDVVKNELSIESDYLKLLRLGSNVTNLIEMKSAERKNFTSDLLSDINVYNELYKKVNEDTKLLRNLLKSVGDKIDRLNVIDNDLLKKEIEDLEDKLQKYKNNKERLQHKYGSIEGKISLIIPEGLDAFNSQLSTLELEYKSEISKLNDMIREQDKCFVIVTDTIDEYISQLSIQLNELKSQLEYNKSMSTFYKDQLNELYNRRDDIYQELKKMSSDLEYAQISNLQIELTKKCEKYKEKFSKGVPTHSKDNMLVILNILIEINKIAHIIYEFDNSAVFTFIKLLKDGTDIDTYIKDNLTSIDKKISRHSKDINTSYIDNNVIVLFKPDGCVANKCPYFDLYNAVFGSDKKDDEESISSLQRQRDAITMIADINRNFEYILIVLKSNSELISKANISYLSLDNIISSIEARTDVYNENILTEYISDIEEYEEFKQLESKLKELDYEIQSLNINKTNIKRIQEELSSIDKKISEIEVKDNASTSNNLKISNKIKDIEDLQSDAERYKELYNTINEVKSYIKSIEDEISSKNKVLSNLSSLITEKNNIDTDIKSVDWEISNLEKDIFDKRFVLKEFDNLSNERNVLNDKFDDIVVIREALSSNKGIPLLFIQLYLKNSKMYVNQLLEMVYGDNFEIDDFEINSTEFNIPYVKNGIRISDVVYASQGERSFLSLALSFALINQSIKDYNILLLDEIDSTLDTHNRSMFLNILEKQMDVINSEQIFLITHNNMFDNYPVDIIMTSDISLDNYKNANIIFSI